MSSRAESSPHPQLEQVRALPLHQHFGLRVLESSGGRSVLELPVTERIVNPIGVLHGGVLYAVLDVAAYVAVLSVLEPTQAAVTHDLHVSCLRPTALGEVLRLEAVVVKAGRSLAFLDARATAGDKLVATARVTKSVVAMG